MAFKFALVAALLAYVNAGDIAAAGLAYSAGPALAYSGHEAYEHAPLGYAAAPIAKTIASAAYAAPAVATYAAPAPAVVTKTIAAAPVLTKTVDADFDPNPQYNYGYDVHDQITGDSKTHQETRDGDVVRGSYSLLEADGTRRIVEYTADAHSGFNAIVRKEAAAVAVKAVAAAPVATYAAAPVVAKTYAAAPVAHYAAAPVLTKTYAAAPVIAKTYAAAAPILAKSYSGYSGEGHLDAHQYY